MSAHPHHTKFNLDHVKELEESIMQICRHCTTLEELHAASSPLWSWACQVLNKSPEKLRQEIEAHETDEHFPDAFSEEKDHLLKLPLVLLEALNTHPADNKS